MKIEHRKTQELKPHPRNYRKHPDDQLEHIKKSIEQNGFYRPVVVADDGTILAGHGVVEACKKFALADQIPVVVLPIKPDSPDALKILTGDNEISHLGLIDDRALTELLRDLKTIDTLLGTGYNDEMLSSLVMVSRPTSEIKNFDAAKEWVGLPAYQDEPDSISMVVYFKNYDDKAAFATKLGMKITKDSKSIWFPPRQRNDPQNIEFIEDDNVTE